MKFQKGDILFESLIAILLFAIAGAGITFISSKAAVAQRDEKVQQQVINELRSMVINRQDASQLCDGNGVTTHNFSTQVNVQGCTQSIATINGTEIEDVNLPLVLTSTMQVAGQNVELRVGGKLPVPEEE